MTIEQTINHLTAQKEMLEFALEYHRNRSAKLDSALQDIRSKTMTLFRLAKTIRGGFVLGRRRFIRNNYL